MLSLGEFPPTLTYLCFTRYYGGLLIHWSNRSVLVLTIAAELAMERTGNTVRGPGTFLPALIDEVSGVSGELVRERAKITIEAY